jgi:DNA-binding transcriptional regulator YbjK
MELSSERPDGGVNRRASIEAGEELGRKIGLQALTHYKAATR